MNRSGLQLTKSKDKSNNFLITVFYKGSEANIQKKRRKKPIVVQYFFTFVPMKIEVLKSKIHRVKVTGADLDYIGSITIDEALLEAANLIVGEKVSIVNVNNGERFETYIIRGERNSGTITLNGPAARKVQKGDIVIIISYALMDFEEAKTFQPTVIFPDERTNRLMNNANND